jgi:hypothetical protein
VIRVNPTPSAAAPSALPVDEAEITAERARLLAEIERLREVLHKIAFEPFGHAEATDRQKRDTIAEFARAALAGGTGEKT